MKKIFSFFVICILVSGYGFSATLGFDELINKLENTYVKPLAKDLGSVLAGGMFHSGNTLGLVPGIDVGIATASSMKPSDDDIILKTNLGKKPYGLPFIQLSKGLPMGFDITLRGFPKTQGVEMLGAGVKYGIIEKEFAVVKMGLSAMYSYNQLKYSTFKASVNSLSGIFSIKIPMIEPYIGIALDSTNLKTDFATAELVSVGKVLNLNVTTTATRYVGGVNFSLIPFTYINVAATYLVDHMGVDFGLGLKF
ncbi:MAG: hypothetical protein PHE88_04980 [Elusimicrobia bacterium]|nr:hypothetical protein [Elusimicrobiota bacterium]